MKSETAKEKFQGLIKEFKKDNDTYCLVHFSRENDYYFGTDNMDEMDALIVIKELIKKHGLSSEIISGMNINPVNNLR